MPHTRVSTGWVMGATTSLFSARSKAIVKTAQAIAIGVTTSLFVARSLAMEPVRLAWVRGEGAEGCGAQSTIVERVTARLGDGAFSSSATRSIEALVARSDKGFRAVLYVRDATGALTGSRELTSESESCASIEAAAVLAIALAIDPDAVLRPPVPPASTDAPTAPPTSPIPTGPLPTPPVATSPLPTSPLPTSPLPTPPFGRPAPLNVPVSSPEPLNAGLSLRGGPGFGLLPSTGAGLTLGGFVSVGARFELTAEALWMPEVKTADGRFAFGLTAFSIGACRSLVRATAVDFGACASVWAGALHAVVFQVEPNSPGDYAWGAASLAPRLRFQVISRVHVDLGAHVIVPFVRRSFEIAGVATPVFQEAPVTALPFLGVGAHFR